MGPVLGAVGRIAGGVGRRWATGFSLAALLAASQAVSGSAYAQSPAGDTETEYGEGLPSFPSEGPLLAVVSLPSQQVRIFDRNGLIASSKVSTGRKGHDTPEGVFSIIERKVEHNSNLYDDASMPFMQRITWSGVALHEGVVPGYRASHGCIRLPSGFAEQLFRTTRIATRVLIAGHDEAPAPISHPLLMQPGKFTPQVAAPPVLQAPPATTTGGLDEAPMMLGAQRLPRPAIPVSAPGPAVPDASSPQAVAPVDPGPTVAELRARRLVAEKRLAAATRAVEGSKGGVRPLLVEQGKAEKALRQAIALTRRAEGRAESLDKALTAARAPGAERAAFVTHVDALIELARARGRELVAQDAAAGKGAAAAALTDKVRKLEAERQAAQNEVRSITRKLTPATLLVSRQTGRIYVRQAFHPVLELPVTIRDPGRPLGTHVFTAFDADGQGAALKWHGLTLETPSGGPPVPPAQPSADPSRRRKGEAPRVVHHPRQDPLETARAALDRIEIPQAVLARVVPSLQAGATLIVSDLGPSIETGPGTDLVVQVRGEEQAKQNIANFVAKKKAEAQQAAYTDPPPRRRRDGGGSWPRSADWNRW
ncbi:MAG: L,D-transpeptidase family protein [Hyphomicrobiaceae bacterium]